MTDTERKRIGELIEREPALVRLREAAGSTPCYLVGGSVRDLLLGYQELDLDIAVEGPVADLALELDPDAVLHGRFDTAVIQVEGRGIDLARTRSERYPRPGALPEVQPAGIERDLERRDFTINALAVPLDEPNNLLDPCGGIADLERAVVRVIHSKSFSDDPTRALRAARYCARLGFSLEAGTADLLPQADLNTISRERLHSELKLIADESPVAAVSALRLAAGWGILGLDESQIGVLSEAFGLLALDPWKGCCSRGDVLLAIAGRGSEWKPEVGTDYPGTPSRASRVARKLDPVSLLLLRSAGVKWLDSWMSDWRFVSLEVTGDDLIASGIPPGVAVGAGLDAALNEALDEGIRDRKEQLATALDAARRLRDRGSPDQGM
jgi:tRNA nucleotidyltransferase (CCA-adding enzyme)